MTGFVSGNQACPETKLAGAAVVIDVDGGGGAEPAARPILWPIPEPRSVGFAGDWHCDRSAADAVLRSAASTGADLVVQLGDFGLWAGYSGAAFLDRVEARCATTGVPVAWLDGNHEEFDFLADFPVDQVTGLRNIRDHVWHIPRGSRWAWAGLRFAALGGGTSLDRPARLPGRSWWEQEAITAAQAEEVIAGGPCDVLLSRDCPAGVPIPGITPESSRRYWPERELQLAWAHAELLASVAAALQPAAIFHGHYHIRHTTNVNIFGGRTRVVGLSDNTGIPSGNRLRVSLAELAAEVAADRA